MQHFIKILNQEFSKPVGNNRKYKGIWPALIQAVYTSATTSAREKIGAQKIKKQIFFEDKFYPLKAHEHYFTALIYLAIWRAAKLGIFTHFTITNLPWCSRSTNLLIYVYSIQISSCLITVVMTLLRNTAAQKNSLCYQGVNQKVTIEAEPP